ncbi:MAG: hypothetical protein II774_11885, partial [Lachnospiraceae bacterium]|nr:hypothetical protein [Lachnospiraceae bacterium]
NASHNKKGESGTAGARTFVERKKTAFLHAHAVQLLLWTWYPADYNERQSGKTQRMEDVYSDPDADF